MPVTAAAADHLAPVPAVHRLSGGRVACVIDGGVRVIKGVPYGTAERLAPPVSAPAWDGIRSSLFYGPIAPQSPSTAGMIGDAHDEDNYLLARGSHGCIQSEDCLRVNVWAPEGGGRRPIMVFLHGGGFFGGSGNDLRAYDGAALARRHDVVVVTANHRLGLLGFLDARALGAPDTHVNVGLQDLALLLEWVRRNAESLGGDPDRVLVFGQSGGAGKAAALMTMPTARDAFQRVALHSGRTSLVADADEAAELAREVAARLGVTNWEGLREVPLDRLIDESRRVGMAWRPVIDGLVVPEYPLGHPLAPASPVTHDVLVGSNRAEFVNGVDRPDADDFSGADLLAATTPSLGAAATALIAAARADLPAATPFALHAVLESLDLRAAVEGIAAAATAGGARAHRYLFAYEAPVIAPRVGTYHSAELAYVFDNATLCREQTGGGEEAVAVADAMSSAWAGFAATGDPGWPVDETMVFDRVSGSRRDVDAALLRLLPRGPVPAAH